MPTIDYLVTNTELSDIADAIRAKGGTSAQLTFPTGFTTAIAAIPTGTTPTGTINISANGTYDVTNYASAAVAIPEYAGAHHAVVPNYTVTVSLTNPVHQSDFRGCTISEQNTSSEMDYGEQLATISGPTGSATISVNPAIYGIAIFIDGLSVSYYAGNISCSGGVSFDKFDSMSASVFEVTGDGTITIDGVDYDD